MKRLFAEAGISGYAAKRSANNYFSTDHSYYAANGSCGTACGTGDGDKKPAEPKPTACGSACGAGDGDKKPADPKPAACGSACGAGDKK